MKILVTGATGQLGNAVITQLLKNTTADQIVALARNEEKAANLKALGIEVRLGSFDDQASLAAATQGIDRVLLISGLDANRFEQHQNVINAAKNSGVKQLVYTSVSLEDWKTTANPLMISHFETEDYLKASGLTYTFLRNTLYAEVIPMFAGQGVFEHGIFFPAGEGKVPYALRSEMGEAAANVLTGEGHENKTYEITGSEAVSMSEIAGYLTELSGKNVGYFSPEPSAFETQLQQFGVPDYIIGMSIGFGTDIKNGKLAASSTDLERLLGRKPTSVKDALKAIYNL